MNAWIGLALALAALVAGGALMGWQGIEIGRAHV